MLAVLLLCIGDMTTQSPNVSECVFLSGDTSGTVATEFDVDGNSLEIALELLFEMDAQCRGTPLFHFYARLLAQQWQLASCATRGACSLWVCGRSICHIGNTEADQHHQLCPHMH